LKVLGGKMDNWIVCGWYTPDYEHWFKRLEQSLIEHQAPYDFQSVPKIAGGWERNTCRKAGFVLDALDRHPGKIVIFLDVDCVVTGDLGALANLPCDIALNFSVLRKKRRINLVPLTGHMVIHPTVKARALIEAWKESSRDSEFGLQDQETLALAMGAEDGVDGAHIMRLTGNGLIAHDSASAASGVNKINGRQRFKHRIKAAFNPIMAWLVGPDEEEYYENIREQLRKDLTAKRLAE
jgi:hypothetical protein